MLKMLIADDEPVIIKGLQMLIDWQQLGIEICCTCKDGADALLEIFNQEPDLALLDISMPGKTGIEILKALHAVHSKTKVIFISGFQDFSYAHDALNYGAVDYLLKPVKKDSLLSAVEKCLPVQVSYDEVTPQASKSGLAGAFSRAAELSPSRYLLVAAHPLGLMRKNEMERRLIEFSVYSQLDTLCGQNNCGFAFQKNGQCYLLLVDMVESEAVLWLHEMQNLLLQQNGCAVGFVYSPDTKEMGDIPSYALPCRDACKNRFYFEGWLHDTVIPLCAAHAPGTGTETLFALQEEISACFDEPDRSNYNTALEKFLTEAVRVADGHPDAAIYHLLVCRRIVQDKLERAGIRCERGGNALLEAAREAADYRAVTELFRQNMEKLYLQITGHMKKNEQKDIRSIMDYIGEHYRESLTLEVLAKHIHMNSFYFSSYFKKHVGQNFKDYLNQIRMERAKELLLCSDKRSYEIAEEVGFRDYRYFNEIFSRHYGKTPTAYRKEFLSQGKESNAPLK